MKTFNQFSNEAYEKGLFVTEKDLKLLYDMDLNLELDELCLEKNQRSKYSKLSKKQNDVLTLIINQLSQLKSNELIKKEAGTKEWFNTWTEVENLGKKQLKANISVGHRVFKDEDGTFIKHKLTDLRPEKQIIVIQSAKCCSVIHPYYAEIWNPTHTNLRVGEERFGVQSYNTNTGEWVNVLIPSETLTPTNIQINEGDDFISISGIYENDYGILTIEYYQQDGANLKHNLTFKSKIAGLNQFRIIHRWNKIKSRKLKRTIESKDITGNYVIEDEKQYIQLLDNNNLPILGEMFTSLQYIDDNGNLQVNYLQKIVVDIEEDIKESKIYFVYGYWEINENEELTLDPDTYSSNNPSEDGDVSAGGSQDTSGTTIDVAGHPSQPTQYKRGYAEWDTSSISDSATVSNTVFKWDVSSSGGSSEADMYEISNQPTASSKSTIYTDCGNGTIYGTLNTSAGQNKTHDCGTDADEDLENLLPSNWFAIGMKAKTEPGGGDYVYWDSEESGIATPKPTLEVTYSAETTDYEDRNFWMSIKKEDFEDRNILQNIALIGHVDRNTLMNPQPAPTIAYEDRMFLMPIDTSRSPEIKDPVTVVSADINSLCYTPRTAIVEVGEHYFAFYRDGSDSKLYYKSSNDGVTWGSATAVTANTTSHAYDWTVWTDGSSIFVAYPRGTYGSAGSVTTYTMKGTPSGATISWGSEITVELQDKGYTNYQFCKAGSTFYLATCYLLDAGSYNVEVYKSTDGSSWTATSLDDATGAGNKPHIAIAQNPDDNEEVILIIGHYTNSNWKYTEYDGSSWDSLSNGTTKDVNQHGYDIGMLYDDMNELVHFVYNKRNGSDEVYHAFWDGSAWSSPTTVDSNTTNSDCTISNHPEGIFLFYQRGGTIYYRKYNKWNYSWGSETTFMSGETSPDVITVVQEPPDTNSIGVVWQAGSSSPYNLRFSEMLFTATGHEDRNALMDIISLGHSDRNILMNIESAIITDHLDRNALMEIALIDHLDRNAYMNIYSLTTTYDDRNAYMNPVFGDREDRNAWMSVAGFGFTDRNALMNIHNLGHEDRNSYMNVERLHDLLDRNAWMEILQTGYDDRNAWMQVQTLANDIEGQVMFGDYIFPRCESIEIFFEDIIGELDIVDRDSDYSEWLGGKGAKISVRGFIPDSDWESQRQTLEALKDVGTMAFDDGVLRPIMATFQDVEFDRDVFDPVTNTWGVRYNAQFTEKGEY